MSMEKFEGARKREKAERQETSGVRRRSDLFKEKDLLKSDIEESESRVEDLSAKIASLEVDEGTGKNAAVPAIKEEKHGFMVRLAKKAKKHKFAVALLAAMGVHLPITPQGQAMTDRIVEAVKGAKTVWEKKGMVLHPQSDEDKERIKAKIFERGARSDAAGQERFKTEMDEKLGAGEDVPLAQEYFGLAKLNGEDPARVQEAQEKKEQLVERLAARMGEEMSDDFIRSVVDEMFGPDENYVWGQASVTEYFLTGKRNCVSIARAEQMVFEELIARLPEKERKRYQIWQGFEKQHEIAAIAVLDEDGSVNRTLYLQPPVRTLVGAIEETGAPTIPLSKIKKAIVSPKPINVKSTVKAGETVEDSPDIEALSNDPVALNIKIEGPLRGSDYVRTIAQQRNIVPVKAVPEKLVGVQELEIEESAQAGIARANQETIEQMKDAFDYQQVYGQDKAIEVTLSDLKSKEQLKLLRDWKGRSKIEKVFFQKFTAEDHELGLGDLSGLPVQEIWFDARKATDMQRYHAIVKDLGHHITARQQEGPRLGLKLESVTDLEPFDFNNVDSLALDVDPEAMHDASVKDVQASVDRELRALLDLPVYNLYLKGYLMTQFDADLAKKMENNTTLGERKKFYIDAVKYVDLLHEYPGLVKIKNIKPWVNEKIDDSVSSCWLSMESPEVLNVILDIIKQSKEKYDLGS